MTVFRRTVGAGQRRPRRLEWLEDRLMLARRSWDGDAGNQNWHDPLNWEQDQLPTTGDDVVIWTTEAVEISADVTVNSLVANNRITIQSGATLDVADLLLRQPAQLWVRDSDSRINANVEASINGASVFVVDGGHASLLGSTSYLNTNTTSATTLRATGQDSVLDLGNVQTIANSTNYASVLSIEALAGGRLNLGSAHHIEDTQAGDTRRRAIDIRATGSNSVVDLSSLMAMTDTWGVGSAGDGRWSTLVAEDGGTVVAPNLTILDGVHLSRRTSGTLPTAQLAVFRSGQLTLDGGHHDLTGLTDLAGVNVLALNGATADLSNVRNLNSADVDVRSGAQLAFPNVTSLIHDSTESGSVRGLTATGADSTLSLPSLQSIQLGIDYAASLELRATDGGELDLRSVEWISAPSGGDSRYQSIYVGATGPDSLVRLDVLEYLADDVGLAGNGAALWSQLVATNGGEIQSPQLRSLRGVHLNLASTGAMPVTQITEFRDGQISLDGGHYDFPLITDLKSTWIIARNGATADFDNVSNLDSASITVESGAQLSFPGVHSLVHSDTRRTTQSVIQVTGAGSRLSLDNAVLIATGIDYAAGIEIRARQGGRIDLPQVQNISVPNGGDTRYRAIYVSATDSGSIIDLSSLARFVDDTGIASNGESLWSTIAAKDGGTIESPLLTEVRGVHLELSASGTHTLPHLSRIHSGQLTLNGGHYDFSSWTDLSGEVIVARNGATADFSNVQRADSAQIIVESGAQLAFPSVTSLWHHWTGRGYARVLRATGASSVLAFPNVEHISLGIDYATELDVEALDGGRIDLGKVERVVDPNTGDLRYRSFNFIADGQGSLIDLAEVTHLLDASGTDTAQGLWSTVRATNGGTINSPRLTHLRGVHLHRNATGIQSIEQITSFESGQITLDGGSYAIPAISDLSGTSIIARNNAVVEFAGVQHLDSAPITVQSGASVSFPNVTTLNHKSNLRGTAWRLAATGEGSRLELPAVTTISNGTFYAASIDLDAIDGGSVNLSALQAIIEPNWGDTRWRSVDLLADGVGSEIDITSLTSFTDVRGNASSGDDIWSTMTAVDGGRLLTGSLDYVVGVHELSMLPAAPLPSQGPVFPPGNESSDVAVPTPLDAEPQFGQPVSLRESLGLFQWIGTSGEWDDPSNWDLGKVPGVLSDVIIDVPGDETITVSGDVNVRSLDSAEHFEVTGGSLLVQRDSTIQGNLTMWPATTLTAFGPQARLTVAGAVTADGANLSALLGGKLHLPGLVSYTNVAGSTSTHTWQAIGRGSTLELSGLERIENGLTRAAVLDVLAADGGSIDLSSVTEVLDTSDGDMRRRAINIRSIGDSSRIDFDSLTRFADAWGVASVGDGVWSTLQSQNGGLLAAPLLTELAGVQLMLDNNSGMATAQLASVTNGQLLLEGGTTYDFTGLTSLALVDVDVRGSSSANFSNVTNIDSADIQVSERSHLDFPLVTAITHRSNSRGGERAIQAIGPASQITLGNVTNIMLGAVYAAQLDVAALGGGQIDLHQVTTISDAPDGDMRYRSVDIVANGHLSSINLASLVHVSDSWGVADSGQGQWSTIVMKNGGEIGNSSLSSLAGVHLDLDEYDAVDTALIHTFTTGRLSLAGKHFDLSGLTDLSLVEVYVRDRATVDFSNVTRIDSTDIEIAEGAVVSFPSVTTLVHQSTSRGTSRTLRASGIGTVLDLSNVTEVRLGEAYASSLHIRALGGALVDMRNVTSLEDPATGDLRYRSFELLSQGIGSHLDLRSVERIVDRSGTTESGQTLWSSLQGQDGGTIDASRLTDIQGVYLLLREQMPVLAEQLQSFESGKLIVQSGDHVFANLHELPLVDIVVRNGASADFPNVTNIDSADIRVYDGSVATFTGVTTFVHSSTDRGTERSLLAIGIGSTIDLSNATSIGLGTLYATRLDIRAVGGGQFDLRRVVTVADSGEGDLRYRSTDIVSDGTGSLIDLSALIRFVDSFGVVSDDQGLWSTLQARNDGEIRASQLAELAGVHWILDGSNGPALDSITTFIDGQLTFSGGGEFLLPELGSLASANVRATNASMVTFANVTNADSVTLIAEDGASISLPRVLRLTHGSTRVGQERELRAIGPDSLLDLSHVTEIRNGTQYGARWDILALGGGEVRLDSATTITETSTGDTRLRAIDVVASGEGSGVHLPSLAEFIDVSGGSTSANNLWSRLTAEFRGTIDLSDQPVLLTNVLVESRDNSEIVGSLDARSGSRVTGGGTIVGDLINAASVAPKRSLVIQGDYTQLENGALEIDIAGYVPGFEHGLLTVSGQANINGSLIVLRDPSFVPTEGDSFQIVASDGLSGVFTELSGLDLGGNSIASPEYQPTGIQLILGFSSGPRIEALQSVDEGTAYASVDIVFNEAVSPFSFGAEDITVEGPDGQIAVGQPIPLDVYFTRYRVSLDASRFRNGLYSFFIGPNLSDFVGNLLNQDGDLVNGEPLEDQFVGEILIDTDSTGPTVIAIQPTGRSNTDITSAVVSFDQTIDANSFDASDVSLTGPQGAIRVSAVTVSPLDLSTFQINNIPITEEGEYNLRLGPDIRDASGNAMSLSYQTAIVLDKTAPFLIASQPSETVAAPWAWFELQFSEPVQVDSIPLTSISIVGPAGLVDAYALSHPAADRVRVHFTPQSRIGVYSVDLAAGIEDLSGNASQSTEQLSITVVAADLAVGGSVAITPASAEFGSEVEVAWTVSNQGNAAAHLPWSDHVWLSSDGVIDATDQLLLSVDAGDQLGLGPSESYDRVRRVTLPLTVDVEAGDYYLLVETAVSTQVFDSDSLNNMAQGSIQLTVPDFPDLAVTNPSVVTGTAVPGATVQLEWTESNLSAVPVTSSRITRLFVSRDSQVGDDDLVASVEYGDVMAAHGTETRSIGWTIPNHVADGPLFLVVQIDSTDEVIETNELNNVSIAGTAIDIPPTLTVVLPSGEVREHDHNPAMRGVVTRTGSRSAPLHVALMSSDDSELTVYPQVTIPAGQHSVAFDLRVVADGIVDGPQATSIHATSPGFAEATAAVTVLDSDLPTLSLTIPVDELTEGQSTTATVSRDVALPTEARVTFTVASPNHLTLPASVVIPANAPSVEFEITATDDALIEANASVEVEGRSPGYRSASESWQVLDNDDPGLELIIEGDTFSEIAGSTATTAVVRRTNVTNRAVTIFLDSSDTTEMRVPVSVTLPPLVAAIRFYVAAIDDDLVDGPRSVTLTATGAASLTGRRLEATAVTGEMIVTDDDGPALFVSTADNLLPEGVTGATTVTVRRNTPPTGDLLISLHSSDDSELSVPTQQTIPDGQTTVSFLVDSLDDHEIDGNQIVVVSATADEYAPGSSTVVVTDTDLPDLVVTDISVPNTMLTDELVTGTFRIGNQGIVATNGTLLQRVFLSDDPYIGGDTLLGQFTWIEPLDVGSHAEQVFGFTAPVASGDYWIVVSTDVAEAIDEGLETNNSRIVGPLHVQSEYTAIVEADVEVALSDTPIPLTGTAIRADGTSPAGDVPVHIHLVVRGTRRTFTVQTDASGTFEYSFEPLPGEAGIYQVAAAHPGVAKPETQDTFTLLGMRSLPAKPAIRVVEGATATSGQFQLENLSDVPLTNLQWAIESATPNLNVQVELVDNGGPNDLPSLGRRALRFQLSAQDASVTNAEFIVHVTSDEGADLAVPVAVTVVPLRPRLSAGPATLVAGMVRGEQKVYEFQVTNAGGRETGDLDVRLPNVPWIELVSNAMIPSLAPGESTSVSLLLSPAADLTLGVYSGTLVVDNANVGLSVPYRFRSISSAVGDLSIEVVDEYTYYAAGQPRVAGATVALRDDVTGDVVANGLTDDDGRLLLNDVTEGYYSLSVSAAGHTNFRDTVYVMGGETTEIQPFVARETVQYYFDVVPTTIEDRTRIEVETVFETNVPVPVVVVTPTVINFDDLEFVNGAAQFEFTLSNYGLVAAQDVVFTPPSHPYFDFTPLISDIGVLPANSSLRIPVTIADVGYRPPRTDVSIGGVVTREDGELLSQSYTIEVTNESTWERFVAAASPTGEFHFLGLEPGYYSFDVVDANVVSIDPPQIFLREGTDISDVEIVVNDGQRLGGTVLSDRDGEPVVGTFVYLEQDDEIIAATVTDDLGRYRFLDTPGTLFNLVVRGDDRHVSSEIAGVELTASNSIIDVTLSGGLTLSGSLTLNDMPLEDDVFIVLEKLDSDAPILVGQSGDGLFSVQAIPAGSYRVTFVSPGRDPVALTLDITQDTPLGEFSLSANGGNGGDPSLVLHELLFAVEIGLINEVNTLFRVAWGNEIADLWLEYLTNVSLVPVETHTFLDGDTVVEGRFKVNRGFRDSRVTQNYLNAVYDIIEKKLNSLECDVLNDMLDTTTAITDLGLPVLDFIGETTNANGMPYEGIGFTLHYNDRVADLPVNIAGGVGSSDPNGVYRLDERHLRGDFTVKRTGRKSGVLETDLRLLAIDAIDFVPGDLGLGLAQIYTRRFQMLELYDRAHDVPFNVRMEVEPQKIEIKLPECKCDPGNSGVVNWELRCGAGDIHYSTGIRLVGFGNDCQSAGGNSTSPPPKPPKREDPVAFNPRLRDSVNCTIVTAAPGTEAAGGGAGSSDGLCAQVAVQIDQTAVQTRDAFEATLQIVNNTASSPLEALDVDLLVFDADGAVVNERFGIRAPDLSGVGDVDGSGAIAAGGVANASWIIIPSHEAAPDGPTEYFVGGIMAYRQNGFDIAIDLTPVSINVLPTPQLHLDYFQERDVYSDDPFTLPVEPSIPFSLAVLVTNEGAGAAQNLRIETAQPRIVENVKGLDTSFTIVGSSVNGEPRGTSLTANFGDIPPGGSAIAEWFMTTPLHGHFIAFDARYVHEDSVNTGVDVALIRSVDVYEMVHTVYAPGQFDDSLPDFLTDDVDDPRKLADTIHFSNGSVADVALVDSAESTVTVPGNPLIIEITADFPNGWGYLHIPDPGAGVYRLTQVERNDGQVLRSENFWQTDRTFLSRGERPTYEHVLHLLDYNSSGNYVLTYVPRDAEPPTIAEIEAIVPDPRITPIATIDVTFTEPIDPATFAFDDLSLSRNGGDNLVGSGVTIVQQSATRFRIGGLTNITSTDGSYLLSIDAAGITDEFGNPGNGLAARAWRKGEFSPVITNILGVEADVRNESVPAVIVQFSEPIDLATFTAEDIQLYRDEQRVAINDQDLVISEVTAESSNSFHVAGLDVFTNQTGRYELRVDATSIFDTVGIPGVGAYSVVWRYDDTGPTVITPSVTFATPRNRAIEMLAVLFDEPLGSGSFDIADLTLQRDGETLATTGLTTHTTNERGFTIHGLETLTNVDGSYELTVHADGVVDSVGNAGMGEVTWSWTLDTLAPDTPANLRFSPDTGLAGDGVTTTTELEISGLNAEAGLNIEVYDETTGEDLTQGVVTATEFTLPVSLTSSGHHRLRVTVTDAAGNRAHTYLELFVNTHPLPGDFDADGQFDADDIDALAQALLLGTTDSTFDLNGDGRVDREDATALIQDILGTHYGDANLDGRVDDVDFAIWGEHRFRSNRGWREADFNFDGLVDVKDFNIWLANRGGGPMLETVDNAALRSDDSRLTIQDLYFADKSRR
ncbi:MAG: hypothetical protein KDA60_00440 [Planctomycetales bacterium]|nr:hypothetical protein [Planctomycetales bacterium]